MQPRRARRDLASFVASCIKKARDFVPGFVSALCVSGYYPNSWTVSAGTDGVLIQQAQVQQQQQFGRNTVQGFYLKTRPDWSASSAEAPWGAKADGPGI